MIEPITDKNLDDVLPLIREYQMFYKVPQIDDALNKRFFSQFGEDSDKGCLFAYCKDGKPVAFATVYFCFSSTLISKVAVMNDLYTLANFRSKGIGSSLIQYCAAFGKSKGAVRLQWVTAPENSIAKSVYTSLGAKQSCWEFFSYTC